MATEKNADKLITRAIHDRKMNEKVHRELLEDVVDKTRTRAAAEKLYKQRTGQDWPR